MGREIWSFVAAACAAILCGCGSGATVGHDAGEQGWVDRAVLDKPENEAFRTAYDTVRVQRDLVGLIRQADAGVDVIVFFGTWCSDSKRQVPHFLKVADTAGIPAARIRLYALDRTKKSDDGLTDTYEITRVPTFIFLRGGAEIGRITETPRAGMEADMIGILAGGGK